MSEVEDLIIIEENEEGTISTIKLNRPHKKNAFNWGMIMGLSNALDEVERSKSRVVVITGTDDCFSSGIDLRFLMGQDPTLKGYHPANPRKNSSGMRYFDSINLQAFRVKLTKMEKPVIARIAGICFGLALEVAIGCDFRFCTESTVFNMTEAKYSVLPITGGLIGLTRLVGIPIAKDIIGTARKFDGKQAYEWGLVTGVAQSVEEMDAQIKNYTDELIDSAPLAVGLGKKMVDWAYGKDTDLGIDLENLINSYLLRTKDMRVGALSRLQKKTPRWRGN